MHYLFWYFNFKAHVTMTMKLFCYSYFLKKCPLTSNCCLSMTFPRYSMMSMSASRFLAARKIFLCFCTRVTRPNWSCGKKPNHSLLTSNCR